VRLTRVIPLFACGLMALAAGCGSGGTPLSQPTTGSSSGASSTSSSAPGINNPLDATKIASQPCSALTPAQLAPYVGTIGKSAPAGSGTSGCNIFPTDINRATISVAVDSNFSLSQLGVPHILYWATRTSDIAGYPAEHRSGSPAGLQTGDCTTGVLVSDHSLVVVEIQGLAPGDQYYKNACVPTDTLVTELISSLKGGG
jgi:hypothetical protein